MSAGVVFAIQRFSLHDGPGIRTAVFLKGCPLRCLWCQNPEGLARECAVWWFDNLCSGCRACLPVCPRRALAFGENGRLAVDHVRCTRCGACVRACPRNALVFDSFVMEMETLVNEAAADELFFATSGGGVTFSGGEPFGQPEFLLEALSALSARGFHTAVETSLSVPWEAIEKAAPLIGLLIVDIKAANPERHKRLTGIDNGLILENFRRLTALLPEPGRLLLRTPLIPGHTADRENLLAIGRIITAVAPGTVWELMNFNPLAAAKYRRMEKESAIFDEQARAYSETEMEAFRNIARETGAAVR